MWQDFTPLVYSVDNMAVRGVRAVEKRLEKLLAENWRREYSEIIRFVQAQMTLTMLQSNTLLIMGQLDNKGLMGRNPGWECEVAVCLEGVWKR